MRRTLWTGSVLAALLAVGAAACSGDGSGPVAGVTSTAGSSPSATPDLGAAEELARGVDVPWGLAFLPGGDALIAERDTGRILRLTPGGGLRQVAEVPGVEASGEGGLLGLAVSPGFAGDNLVYAYFTAADDNRIVRFRLDGGDPEVIFDGIAKARNHNGGRIAFGPDGMLYAGTGDAGRTSRSQDPAAPTARSCGSPPTAIPRPATRPRRRRSTASATATCRAWPGTPGDGCSPPSSARTTSTR